MDCRAVPRGLQCNESALLRTGKQNYIQRSSSAQWTVVTIYLLYLLPYVVISYDERYAMPLVAVKVLLVVWAVDRLLALASRAEDGDSAGRAAHALQ